MRRVRWTPLQLRIMQALWKNGASSIREIHETFPEKSRPAYTTIQTTVYRLENKKAVKRGRKIGNAHLFEAIVTRDVTQEGLAEELLSFFGGKIQPVMAHFIQSGKLTMEDVKEAERTLRELAKKEKAR